MALTMAYKDPRKPELDEIAQEINGFDLTTGKRLDTFAELKDDGTTTAGDWIYTGHYPEAGNLSKRRDGVQDPAKNDPTGMGYYHGWAWSWPLNRRVLYNRASADLEGKPVGSGAAGHRVGRGRRSKWIGDVPDYPADAWTRRSPKARGPFIMTGEGVGPAVLAARCSTGRSPSTTSRWSRRSRTRCTPNQSESPVAFLYDKAAGRDEPLRHREGLPVRRDQLPADRARALRHPARAAPGRAAAGGRSSRCRTSSPARRASRPATAVRVSSKRGKLEVPRGRDQAAGAAAGRRQEGLPDRHPDPLGLRRHRGRPGPDQGANWLANALTPFVGDANSRTPEFKAFLVNIEKI